MLSASLAVGALLAALTVSALASEKIHGVVLAVQSNAARVVIRHDAIGGMPAMTMAFRIVPPGYTRRMHAKDLVDATVSRETEPWTLSGVSIRTPHTATTRGIIRDVKSLQVGDSVPQTSFVDQTGHPFTFADFAGHAAVLAFIYTRCNDPHMCPLISAKFNQLQTRFQNSQTHLIEITLDPDYDRPPVLAAYGRNFGARSSRWTIGTGDPDEVLNFAAAFGLSVFPDEKVGLIHAERTAIINPQGKITSLIDDPGWSPAEIAAEVKTQSHQAANPLARLDLLLSSAAVAVCGNRVAGFSGLFDLGVVLVIFGSFGWLFFRLGKVILASKA